MSAQGQARTIRETIAETEYRIQVQTAISHDDYEGRVEIERDSDGETWQFHVNEHGAAHYHMTTAVDDLLVTPEIPEWVELVLGEIGIEGIEE